MFARLAVAVSLLSCSTLVTGCSTSFAPTPSPYSISSGTITGQVHGGRGPVVGAHIFVFAAGTTADAGPGIAADASNKSMSLLNNSSAAGFPTTQDLTGNSSSNPTYGDYYVTTNASGSFALGGEYTCTQGTQVYLYSSGGNPGGSSVNSAAGLMAVLGQCPNSGTMAALTPTVYMNEVSTVAAAYAFAGYATDATHVSSNSSAAALTGIANSFANAAMLYDISGATNQATANTTIPGNSNGTVASGSVNSLANSLAACVNSSAPTAAQCTSGLFNAVMSTGTTGNTATDTATEAIYIAHNPGTAVTTVFNNTSGIGTPFQTALSSHPNDWTIGVYLSGSGLATPYVLAFDGKGNAWVFGAGQTAFSPQAVPFFSTSGFGIYAGGNGARGALDNSGYVWLSVYSDPNLLEYWGTNAVSPTTPGTADGSYSGAGLGAGLYPSIDAKGNIWINNYYSSPTTTDISVFYGSNAPSPHNPGDPMFSTAFGGGGLNGGRSVVQDFTGYAWAGSLSGLSGFCATNPGCTLGTPVTSSAVAPAISAFWDIALDATGNVWGPSYSSGTDTIVSIYGFSAPSPHHPGELVGSYTGGGLDSPLGYAVDGSGNVWVNNYDMTKVNQGQPVPISEFTNAGVPITTSAGYTSSGAGPRGGYGIAIDESGNVWIPSSIENNIEILIGAATPVVTPISANLLAPYGIANVNRP